VSIGARKNAVNESACLEMRRPRLPTGHTDAAAAAALFLTSADRSYSAGINSSSVAV
jgi:hypothetical protein